jgi:hypothetical protein
MLALAEYRTSHFMALAPTLAFRLAPNFLKSKPFILGLRLCIGIKTIPTLFLWKEPQVTLKMSTDPTNF